MQNNQIHPYGWRYFLDIISHEPGQFQKVLNGMNAEKKKQLLLVPLSDETRENALTYIAGDRIADSNAWRSPFLVDALDAIDQMNVTNEERLKVLTSANELGQTVFLKALKYPQNSNLFSILQSKLCKWGGDEYAGKFIDAIYNEPLGTIDPEISKGLKGIENDIMPYDCEDHMRLASLANGNYMPATAKGLRATIDKLRPLLQNWIKDNAGAYDHIGPDMQKVYDMIKAFIANPDPVTEVPFKLNGRDKTNRTQLTPPPKPPKPPQL